MCVSFSSNQQLRSYPSQHSMLGHHRPVSETPFKWCFTDGPMMTRFEFYTGMEMGPWFKVSSNRLGKSGIKPATPGLHGTATPGLHSAATPGLHSAAAPGLHGEWFPLQHGGSYCESVFDNSAKGSMEWYKCQQDLCMSCIQSCQNLECKRV